MDPDAVPASQQRSAAPMVREPAGPLLFSRYAYPPNQLGYCGPADHQALLEYGAVGLVDRGLVQLAQGFAGAWPYLELIAHATGIGDPLDRRVVEAYWVGNALLDRVDMLTFGNSLMDRFRRRSGSAWGHLAEAIPAGAVPHHSFHVFGVYPWVGLLGEGRKVDHPLRVLDRCRIRWGRVVAAEGNEVVVPAIDLGRPAAQPGCSTAGDRHPSRRGNGVRHRPPARRLGLPALALGLRPVD
jgi:hypothetical protein